MNKMKNDKKGFTIGEVLVVLGIVLVVVLMLQPVLQRTYEKADRSECMSNLRELGRAVAIYAREHRGNFPPTIKTLYEEEYLADTGVLDCGANKKKGTLDNPEYIYIQGLSVRDPSTMELIKDAEGNHSGGSGVLTVNGTVTWQASAGE